jgi:catechol 2,3-dioxygenase-like lactoylglutathione lyase family enzyme
MSAEWFQACAAGDVDALGAFAGNAAALVRAADPATPHAGWTGLHSAARNGRLDAVCFLLQRGADPNAREAGDNTTPLHWAAAGAHLEVVRALLDAGADVHGFGDVHELDTIGWASFFKPCGEPPDQARLDVVSLLCERGARRHIFSALCLGDAGIVRAVAREGRAALARRTSRFEGSQTALHFAMSRKRYDLLDLLIAEGADLEAVDGNGRTALEVAMLAGDREAMRRLDAAGAKAPDTASPADLAAAMRMLAGSVRKGVPMIYVPDVARALDWYSSIGFTELARYGDDGLVNFRMVAFGKAELMLNMHGKPGPHDASLWFYTDRVDELYRNLKARQIESARAALAGRVDLPAGIEFDQDIEDMFYGARQFAIRDPNGYVIYFIQDLAGA